MNARRHLATLARSLRPHRLDLVAAGLSMVAVPVLYLLLTWRTQALVGQALPAGDLPAVVGHLAVGVLLVSVAAAITFVRDFLLSRLSHRVAASQRSALFARVLALPLAARPRRSGDLLSRLSNDVHVFQEALGRGVAVLVPNLVVLACLVATMAWYSWRLALFMVALLAPLTLTIRFMSRRVHGAARRAQHELGELTSLLDEAVAGTREIKAFVREAEVRARFEGRHAAWLRAQVQQDRDSALHPALVTVVSAVFVAGLMIASVWLLGQGRLPSGDLVAFLTCLLLASPHLQDATRSIDAASRLFVVMDRFAELFRGPAEEAEEDRGLPALPPVRGEVALEHVGFAHGRDGFELADVDLTVAAGETVVIVGPSGSGKSTLLDLIPRFLDPHRGTVRIDGHDLRDYQRASIRARIGVVPQEGVLFEGTLLENLRFGRLGATLDEVLAVARAAHVDEFVRRLPAGYDTWVDPGGANFSVGERQRLAIARALLKDPAILLLDEPTSALDTESERLVQNTLAGLGRARTVIIVAHRLSTVRIADRIVVLEAGRVREVGTHAELLANRGLYRLLAGAGMDA